jgi:hypothetical protein
MKATFDIDTDQGNKFAYCPHCGGEFVTQNLPQCPKCFCKFEYRTDKLPTIKTVTVTLSDNPVNYAVMGKYAPSDKQWLDICVAYDGAKKNKGDDFVFGLTTRQANRLQFELMNNVLAVSESSDSISRMIISDWVQKSYDDAIRITDQIRNGKK